jgi:phage tail tape-measure protein
VNAWALGLPRSGVTSVVDGATAFASMVPADRAPLSPTNHIWYPVPGVGDATLFTTSTPAFFSRECSGATRGNGAGDGAHVRCSEHLRGGRRQLRGPQPNPALSAPRPITTAAAAANSIVRQGSAARTGLDGCQQSVAQRRRGFSGCRGRHCDVSGSCTGVLGHRSCSGLRLVVLGGVELEFSE